MGFGKKSAKDDKKAQDKKEDKKDKKKDEDVDLSTGPITAATNSGFIVGM